MDTTGQIPEMLSKAKHRPEHLASAFASAESLRQNYLDQTLTLSDMCVSLAIERVRMLCKSMHAYDVKRLAQSMRAHIKAGHSLTDALELAATKGQLDFPRYFSSSGAPTELREACKKTLSEILHARAALPGQREALDMEADIPDPQRSKLTPSNL